MDINGNVVQNVKLVNEDTALATPSLSTASPSCILFPLIQRPSGVIPRQNSGINAILDTDLATESTTATNNHNNASSSSISNILPNSGTGQIRTSYEKPSSISSRRQPPPTSSHPPLRLANIIQQRMRQGSGGSQQKEGVSPAILNKAFFESVREQVNLMKNAQANESKSSYFSGGSTLTSSAPSTIFSMGELEKCSRVAVPRSPSSKFSISELDKSSRMTVGCGGGGGGPPSSTCSNFCIEELEKSSTNSRVGRPILKNSTQGVVFSPSQAGSTASSAKRSSGEVKEIVINRDDSGANLNINFTVKLGHFDGNSATGFGLKNDGSANISSHVSTIEAASIGTSNYPSIASSAKGPELVTNSTSYHTHNNHAARHTPPVVQGQPNLVDVGQPDSGDWDLSGVTSVLSAELLALDEKTEDDPFSTTDIIYNTMMSIASSSSIVAPHQRIMPTMAPPHHPVAEKMPSAQVFNNASTFLSLDNMTSIASQLNHPAPSHSPSATIKSAALSSFVDENGNDVVHHHNQSNESLFPVDDNSSLSKKESRAYVLQAIINALDVLEKTGDSIGTAATNTLSLIANIVPMDNMEFDEETMDASESDLPIQVMRLLGVPKTTRHNIYSEACGEVEVLQELGTGTYDALTTVLKWVCGGKQGREEFMAATRTFCSVLTEVDRDSEAWNDVNAQVGEIAEAVGEIAEDIVEDGVDTAEALGNTFVKMVNEVAKSALSQNVDDDKIEEETEEKENDDYHNIPLEEENDEDCKALEVFFDTLIDETKFEKEELEDTNKPVNKTDQEPLVDINNNNLVECSSSQQFVPCLDEKLYQQQEDSQLAGIISQDTSSSSDLLEEEKLIEDDANDDKNKKNPYSFGKLLEVTQSASLMYEPAYRSKDAHTQQASMSSMKLLPSESSIYNSNSSLPNLERFFSNRTLNARTFKNFSVDGEHQSVVIINSAEEPIVDVDATIVSSSSAHLLAKMPRAPPNSEARFDDETPATATADSVQHQEKVIKDMTEVSKLVQDLYDCMNTPLMPPPPPQPMSMPNKISLPDPPTQPSTKLDQSPTAPTPKQVTIPEPQEILTLDAEPQPKPTLAIPQTPVVELTPIVETCPSSTPTILTSTPTQTPSTPIPRMGSKLQLLPSRIPIPRQVSGILKRTNPNSTTKESAKNSIVPETAKPQSSKRGGATEQSFVQFKDDQDNNNNVEDLELPYNSSATSVYSISGDSIPSRSYSRSFFKPTMSSAAKTNKYSGSNKRKTSQKVSATGICSSAKSSSTRISSNTSLQQKTSASSMESNTNWLSDELQEEVRPQSPQVSYQKIYQKKNSSMAKQLSTKRFRF